MATLRDRKLSLIVKTLKEEFRPARMFLFGSRAQGTAKPDSDYDFVLVVPGNKKSRINNMTRAADLIWDKFKVKADVFVYSEREFRSWENEFSSIPETAKNTGREIDLG